MDPSAILTEIALTGPLGYTGMVVVQTGAAGMFTKVLVDIVKTSPLPSPSAILPILAFIFGEIVSLLLHVAGGGTLNSQSYANIALVGILAAGSAMGVTALQNKSNEPSIK